MLSELVEVLEEVNEVDLMDEQLQKKLVNVTDNLVLSMKTCKNSPYHGAVSEGEKLLSPEPVIDLQMINKLVIALRVSSDYKVKVNIMTAFKMIASNKTGPQNTSLGKTEIFNVLMYLLEQVKSVPPSCRKLALDLLNILLKNNLNSIRAARQGLARQLLHLLSLRRQLKNKARFKFCKVLINGLYQIAKQRVGRHQLSETEGLRELHQILKEFPDDERYDPLLNKLGTLILKCNAPQSLPFVNSIESPLKFSSPNLKFPTEDHPSPDSSEDESEGEETRHSETKMNDELPYLLKWRPLDEIQENYGVFFQNQHDDSLSSIEKNLKDLPGDERKTYELLWKTTKGILPFQLAAYPDMVQANGMTEAEPLNPKQRKVCRAKLLETVGHSLHPENYKPTVVYDLDELVKTPVKEKLSDEALIGRKKNSNEHLNFEARFESGNLRKALKVGSHEYDLILTPDVNSRNRQIWFYFRVSNMETQKMYTFRIINLEKQRSLFNEGMQPLLFSVRQCLLSGKTDWQRCGQDICYYRSVFRNPASTRGKNFMTLAFSLMFPHESDICYLAFHYPYTYTRLLTDCQVWISTGCEFMKVRTLCRSPNGNPVPVIFFGNASFDQLPISKIAVFTARVHPGESNSSFVMQGLIDAILCSKNVKDSTFWNNKLIIIVPMLNVDGVINGCGRCDVSNEDLNRHWNDPDSFVHSAIYHTKGLVEYLVRVTGSRPDLFCDLHGHSRKLNVFLYGCSRHNSWRRGDHHDPDDSFVARKFSGLIAKQLPAFDSDQCSWQVERYRETTARVFFWRNLNIASSFTIESSLAGGKTSGKSDCQYNTEDYRNTGSAIYSALLNFWSQD